MHFILKLSWSAQYTFCIAKFESRSCMLPCSDALLAATPTDWSSIGLSPSVFDFRQMIKVSTKSPHFEAIREQVLRFDQAGMLKRVFQRQHEKSYRYVNIFKCVRLKHLQIVFFTFSKISYGVPFKVANAVVRNYLLYLFRALRIGSRVGCVLWRTNVCVIY